MGTERTKITICDDSIEDLLCIEKNLLLFKHEYRQTEFEIVKYTDSMKLYEDVRKGYTSDIFFLDMVMPGRSGTDIGDLVRSLSQNSILIYVTSSREFALDAYRVKAVRYLVKPFKKEELFEAAEYALQSADRSREPVFTIKTQEGLQPVSYSAVVYIENASRTLCVHLANGLILKSIFIRKSFEKELAELLLDRNFIQIHKSFVVNMAWIQKLTQETVTVSGGQKLPVSKNRMAEVRRCYLSYVADKYR